MSRQVVEIPIEVWEQCQQDAETIASLHKECIRLNAKVERLTKAGDNLARACDENGFHDNGDWDDQQDAMKRWDAAKEGKQS